MSILKRAVLSSEWLSGLALERMVRREEDRVSRMQRQSPWNEVKFWGVAEVLDALQLSVRNDTCHIIASGSSALASIRKIRGGKDFVFGFNFAALLDLEFDAYFIEIASPRADVLELSDLQAELVSGMAAARLKMVFAKNLWEGGVDLEFMRRNYRSPPPMISDILMPHLPLDRGDSANRATVRSFLKRRETFIPQIRTTAFTWLAIAHYLGFRRVVFHGLDMYGPYWFSQGEVDAPNAYLTRLRKCFPEVSSAVPHETSQPVRCLLPVFADVLRARGCELFVGAKESPAAEFLPVFPW